jgi:hypothetical protein
VKSLWDSSEGIYFLPLMYRQMKIYADRVRLNCAVSCTTKQLKVKIIALSSKGELSEMVEHLNTGRQ